MRNITFGYSVDGGSSFVTPITVKCNVVHVYLLPEELPSAGPEPGGAFRDCKNYTQRLHVAIEVSSVDLNPKENANGATNFTYLQKWQCAPVRRIYNADVSADPGIDGWTEFDTSTNTVYLNIDQPNAPTFEDMRVKATGGRQVRSMTFQCYTRDAVAL